MAKRLKMSLRDGEVVELGDTDSLPHPANFPLGSIESRAAARAVVATGRLRPGDRGTFKCGCSYFVVSKTNAKGEETSGTVQMILPKDFSNLMKEHVHDYEVVA